MRFMKSRDNGAASKISSAHGQEKKSAKPKYEFEFEDSKRETENECDDSQDERDINRNLLLARSRSRAIKQHESGPTTRHENEDPRANELFQDVPEFKEGLQPEGQRKRPTPYEYPPENFMRGRVRPTRRAEGDDPVADQLLAGASERQGPTQPQETPVPALMANGESLMIKSALGMRALGLSGRNRKKGEDFATDALFNPSGRA